MFVGSQFCPHCGAKAVEAENTGGTVLKCPGCSAEMPSVRVGAVEMHQCSKCGSVWLEPQVFSSLCADREARGAALTAIDAALNTGPSTGSPTVDGAVRYVRCPSCSKTLNRVNFGRTSGVIVDVCKSHGVWFERDELRRVLAFVERGGLEPLRAGAATPEAVRLNALGIHPAALGPQGMSEVLIATFNGQIERNEDPLHKLLHSLFS